MRIAELTFERAGLWKGLPPLTLGPRVTVVLGDNESGKTTAMRALSMLLFGRANEDYSKLVKPLARDADFVAHAEGALSDGAPFRLTRRGQRLEATDSSHALEELLASAHVGRFRGVFFIDHSNLRAGGKLLSLTSALGDIVFAASTGERARDLAEIEGALEKLTGKSKNRKSLSTLKEPLERYEAARRELEELPRFKQYDERKTAVDRLRERVVAAKEKANAASAELDELAGLVAGLSAYEKRAPLQSELDALAADGAIPDAEWPGRAEALAGNLRDADGQLPELARDEADARARLEELPAPSPLLDLGAEIKDIDRLTGLLPTLREELERKRRELATTENELAQLVRQFGGDPRDDAFAASADALIIPLPQREALKSAIEAGRAAGHARAEAKKRLDKSRSALATAERALAEAPPMEVRALTEASQAVARALELDESARRLRSELIEVRARARHLAVTLGLAGVPVGELATLPVASPELILQGALELDTTTRARDSARTAREGAEGRLTGAEAELDERTRALAAPSRDDLDAARRARDAALEELAARWLAPGASDQASALSTLTTDYRRQVSRADEVADLRFDAAAQAGALEGARRVVSERARERDEAVGEDQRRSADHQRALDAWRALWPFCQAPPENPKAWLSEHQNLLALLAEAESLADQLTTAEGERDELRTDALTLARRELPAVLELDGVRSIQKALEAELAVRAARNQVAEELLLEVKSARDRVREGEGDFESARQDEDDWQRRWEERGATLPPGVTTDMVAVEAWLDAQARLESRASELRALTGGLARQEGAIVDLEVRARALIDRALALTPEVEQLRAIDPRDAVVGLVRLLEDAERKRAEREQASQAHARARDSLSRAERARERAEGMLAEAWREAGLAGETTDAALAGACARARCAQELRRRLAELDSALVLHWPAGVASAQERLGGRSIAELETARAELEAGRGELIKEQERLTEELGVARAEFQELEAERGGADPAQELAFARAEVLARAEALVRLEAAKWLITKAKQRAAEGADFIVARASELFAALTDGAYTRLVIDRDGSEPTLVAESASGSEKQVTELSDGTADTIWFALRLAIAERAAESTPFPLLLDDVFVHLDDLRTTAALKVLAKLSKHVQVLVFTHHDHVLELARAAIGGALTEVILATAEEPKHERLLPPGERTRHERPRAPTMALEAPATSAHDAYECVARVLREQGEAMDRREIIAKCREHGVDIENSWSSMLSRLKDDERIEHSGQKRGARYRFIEDDTGREGS
ncbi:MAG: AAA family ATPase [Sorangiineae bacterium]|nr:AAA family ATPase [Polyangiaceae bacterium]MEB2321660.1 AAA family ATPase [Sorangiineae bacterium]